MEINGYSEKATPYTAFPVGEVALSQDDPLSVDLTMVPEWPNATNTPEPDDDEEEEELSEVLVELSEESSEDEVVLSVLEEELSSAHEEAINAILTNSKSQ